MDSLARTFHERILPLLAGAMSELGRGIEEVLAEIERVQVHGLSSAGTGEVLLRSLQRFSQTMTDADCSFIRRVNIDGSLERLPNVDPFWRPGQAEVGVVPWITQPGTGVGGWLFKQHNGQPVVIRDVHDMDENLSSVSAHRQSILRCADQEEAAFLNFIASEVCVPLVVEGQTVAMVVNVRGTHYPPAEAEAVLSRVNKWGPVLILMYAVAATLADVDDTEDRLKNIVRAWPLITTGASDKSFYSQMATVLTCDKGLSWHRAMIFRIRGRYPADATCVMALGSIGDVDWFKVQAFLSKRFRSLEEYLEACLTPDFGCNDALYKLISSGEQPWVVSPAALGKCGWLKSSLEGQRPVPTVAEGVLPIWPDNPFMDELRATDPGGAFGDCASDRPLWVVPLVLPERPLGFVLLDRPYVHRRDLPMHLPLTRLICDMFSGLLAVRSETPKALDGRDWAVALVSGPQPS
jgi:hypothetical protein